MKKFTFLFALFFSVTFAFSQSFMHGAGLCVFVGTANGGDATASQGVTYSPRFNFVEEEDLSVSVGIPLSLGISGSYNSRYSSYSSTTNNTLSFMMNAPLIVNLNMGCGSTKENESRFGYFIGGGFGYHYGSYNQTLKDSYGSSYTSATNVSAIGPVGNAGVRFGVGAGSHNIEVRLSYMKGIDASKANIFGAGTLFNF